MIRTSFSHHQNVSYIPVHTRLDQVVSGICPTLGTFLRVTMYNKAVHSISEFALLKTEMSPNFLNNFFLCLRPRLFLSPLVNSIEFSMYGECQHVSKLCAYVHVCGSVCMHTCGCCAFHRFLECTSLDNQANGNQDTHQRRYSYY